MLWDRHEIDVRNKMKKVIERHQINGELFGLVSDLAKEVVILRPMDMSCVTEELYQLLLTEMDKHVRRNKQDPVD